MHTEIYCENLEALDPVKAIRAIQEALLQISAIQREVDVQHLDNVPAMTSLVECLRDVGHTGFVS